MSTGLLKLGRPAHMGASPVALAFLLIAQIATGQSLVDRDSNRPYVDIDASDFDDPVGDPSMGCDPFEYPAAPYADGHLFQEPWEWQFLPDGLIYRSYLAGVKEPRIGGTLFRKGNQDWLLDVTLGGRVGMLRYGTNNDFWPEGWQLDIEGAAFPRLNLEENWDMESADFRFGVPLTYGMGNVQTKLAYYHLSSHLGDEFVLRNASSLSTRINFSRDVLVFGISTFPHPDWRLYGETGWAFHTDGGSQPWEFQFGFEIMPPLTLCVDHSPFLAINVHLREEVDFGGNLVVQTGWLCRSRSGHLFRIGFQYLNGKSSQFQFFDQSEQQVGVGLWYDY